MACVETHELSFNAVPQTEKLTMGRAECSNGGKDNSAVRQGRNQEYREGGTFVG